MINIIIGFTNEINSLEKTLEYLNYNNFLLDNFYKIIIMSKGIYEIDETFLKKNNLKKGNIVISKYHGIYPSLNYCSSLIKDDHFIWFLGAGDLPNIKSKLLKDKILKAEQYYNFNKEKIIGHCFDVDIYSKNDIFLYRHYQRIEIPYSLILNTLHHQGIIIKNSYIKKYNYPTFTKTYSDYSLLLNIYNKKLKLKFHNNSIAKFQLGGKSSNSKIIYWIESSKLRFKYLNLIYALFFSIMHFFINLIFIKDLFFKKK